MIYKKIIVICLLLSASFVKAQDLTSKKGSPILPEAGDWGIGIDATPFFDYLGNFFGKGGSATITTGTVQAASHYSNKAPAWNFLTNSFTISGKKFIDAKTAYRATVRLGFNNTTTKNQTQDRSITTAFVYPTVPFQVENTWQQSSTNISASFGIEKRRGKTRLQGFYGVEGGIGFSSGKNLYKYGNQLSIDYKSPVNVDIDGDGFNVTTTSTGKEAINITKDTYNNVARIKSDKSGLGFEIGARAFAGAEFFIAPKLSIAGEFGWGMGFGFSGKSKLNLESIGSNGTEKVIGSQEILGSKTSTFYFDNDNKNSIFGPKGSIRLNLYF
jgi:hypothetical protein